MFQKYTKLYIPVQTIISAKKNKRAQWEESPFLFNEATPVIMSAARFSMPYLHNQFSLHNFNFKATITGAVLKISLPNWSLPGSMLGSSFR